MKRFGNFYSIAVTYEHWLGGTGGCIGDDCGQPYIDTESFLDSSQNMYIDTKLNPPPCGEPVRCEDEEGTIRTTWQIPAKTYEYVTTTCAQTGQGGGTNCTESRNSPAYLEFPGATVQTPCAPGPHSLRFAGEGEQLLDCDTCTSRGTTTAAWNIVDGNGNVIQTIYGSGLFGPAHEWINGDPTSDTPTRVNVVNC